MRFYVFRFFSLFFQRLIAWPESKLHLPPRTRHIGSRDQSTARYLRVNVREW